jgi:hypothetical protein
VIARATGAFGEAQGSSHLRVRTGIGLAAGLDQDRLEHRAFVTPADCGARRCGRRRVFQVQRPFEPDSWSAWNYNAG